MERVLPVTVEDFQIYFVHILRLVKDFDENLRNENIAPAGSGALQYINNWSYLEGEKTLKLMVQVNSSTAKMDFIRNVIFEMFADFKRGDIIIGSLLRNIELGT